MTTAAIPVPSFLPYCGASGPETPIGGHYTCTKRGCDGNHEAEGLPGQVIARWTDPAACACEQCALTHDDGCPNTPPLGKSLCNACRSAVCAELADDAASEEG